MLRTSREADDLSARGALPYAMIIAAAMILASNHIIARYLNGVVLPIGLVFWRMTVGSLVLVIGGVSLMTQGRAPGRGFSSVR